jgi:phage repressor protein C with HTH and peptisase S24 domain
MSRKHEWINSALKQKGSTQRALADALGLPPPRVSEIIRGERTVKAAELPGLANHLDMPLQDVVIKLGLGNTASLPKPNLRYDDKPKNKDRLTDVSAKAIAARPAQDLPVYGTAAADDGSYITINTNEGPIEYCTRPSALLNKANAYALYVVGESMEPRFFDGDRIYIDAARPARPKDDVVVQLVDSDGQAVNALIKRLVKKTKQAITLEQYNPARIFDIDASLVASIHRVLTYEDLAG